MVRHNSLQPACRVQRTARTTLFVTRLLQFNEAEVLLLQSGVVHIRVSEHSEPVKLIGQDGCPEAQGHDDIRRRVEDESCVGLTANPVESESRALNDGRRSEEHTSELQ